MSSTTLFLHTSLEQNCGGVDRFCRSLLPKWLYLTMDVVSWPEQISKSTSTDLTLVWPDLKSSPPTKRLHCHLNSRAPGTSMVSGDPPSKEQPSKMLATANSMEGDTSRPSWMVLSRFSAVSLRPGITSEKCSVFAVFRTMTSASPAPDWKLQKSVQISSSCWARVPRMT